jgi:hypothetical protein
MTASHGIRSAIINATRAGMTGITRRMATGIAGVITNAKRSGANIIRLTCAL